MPFDPNEVLAHARRLINKKEHATEHFRVLDDWITNGGDLPEDWKPGPPVPENLKLTPTAEMFLEVLAARTRLGHTLWTFASHSSILVAAKRLEDAGLITTMHGSTEGTFRAELTKTGRRYAMDDPSYVPPILGGPK